MIITWKKCDEGGNVWYLAEGLPRWRDGLHPRGEQWGLWIEKRPPYCDRGRWILKTTAPLDHQEGFPRYYFVLEIAKVEALAWCQVRKELQHDSD